MTKFIKYLTERNIKHTQQNNNTTTIDNKGSVYLRSLTVLPENVKFNNKGYVYLDSLNNTEVYYRGQKFIIRTIDGYPMLCNSFKNFQGVKVTKAFFFKGGELKDLKECFIAEKDDLYAHGETLKKAVDDLNFKYLQKNLDKTEVVKGILKKGTVSRNEYRLLTGACKLGVENFCTQMNITEDELHIEEVLKITKGAYGHHEFLKHFNNSSRNS